PAAEGIGSPFIFNTINAMTFQTDSVDRLVVHELGNIGIRDLTPDALLDLDFNQTSGTLFGIAAPSSVTLAGALTGQSLNLSTNVTATGQSVTGSSITLPTVTNTGASTYNYTGLSVTGNALTQNNASGTTAFTGLSVTNANITQTAGTSTSTGLSVTTGSITTGGTQTGLAVTAAGVGVGNLYAVNVSNITGGGGTERAINIGTGWDYGIYSATTGASYFAGNVGIGDTSADYLLDVLSSGAADTVFTLANTNAGDYDPVMKFELTEGTPLFTLGIDDSDSDKFKIFSGDGLSSGDEFVIDANGTTTIANLNLGATTFDENAGAVTWIDMSVTSAAAVDTVESYTAAIDGNSLLTVYAESDGAGGIQNRAINLFDTTSLVEFKSLSTNFGTVAYGGTFISNNSTYNQEFASDAVAATTADSAAAGDDSKWYFDTTGTTVTFTQADSANGLASMAMGTTTGVGGMIGYGDGQNNLSLIFAKANLPVLQMKVRTNINNATNDIFWGFMDQATAPTTNDTKPANGIYFWNNNASGAWQGVVRSGSADVGTVTCPGSISTTQFAVGRIEVISSTSVKFSIDNDVSDGVSLTSCGTVSGANPTAALGIAMYDIHTETTTRTIDLDYVRVSQDDAAPGSVVAKAKPAKSLSIPDYGELGNLLLVTDPNASKQSIDANLTVIGDALDVLYDDSQAMSDRLTQNETYLTNDKVRLDTQDTLLAQMTLDMNTQVNKTAALESQMQTLTDQMATLTDFFTTLDLGNVMIKDIDGNVDLLGGKLKASIVETGGLVIEVVDEDAPTIGTAEILPVSKDEDGDGKDDETGSDGRSVEIRTKAMIPMVNGSRIFTSFKGNPNAFSWVEKVRDEAGDYVGFKIRLSDPVTDVVKVDWWLIEQKDTFPTTP
ncbi:MAG: hypothetical protein WBO92_04165, partial [Candidatus Moraniibacteriota bacterium]